MMQQRKSVDSTHVFPIGNFVTGEILLYRRRSNRPGNSQAQGPSTRKELWKVRPSGLRPRCKRPANRARRETLRLMTEGALNIALTRGGVP